MKQQQTVLEIQLAWAVDYKLPVVIHARDSFTEIFDVIRNFRNENLKGVFHSFTGNVKQAEIVLDMEFLLGLNGILTFKNSGLDKVISEFDTKYMILETDSPYLAPTPKRGKRNESAFLPYIAQKLADIHNLSVDQVMSITTANAKNLFSI